MTDLDRRRGVRMPTPERAMRTQRDFNMSLPEAWKREHTPHVTARQGTIDGSMVFLGSPLLEAVLAAGDPLCTYSTLTGSLRSMSVKAQQPEELWGLVTATVNQAVEISLPPAEALKQQAREAAEALNGETRLEQVWKTVDGVVGVIEGKMRVLLTSKRARPPEISHAVADALKKLEQHDASAHAKRLLSALFDAFPRAQGETEIGAGPTGTIEARIMGEITWLISAPRLPWPGTSVRAYFPRTPGSAQLDTETFHLAHTLIERTTQALEDAT